MDNIVFVTGADRGLGLALTARLLDKGWKVYAGQYMPDWTELTGLKEKYADKLTLIPLDVALEKSVKEAAEIVARTTDHVDLLINNAGITSSKDHRSIHEVQDYEELQKIFNVNTLGPLRVVEAFLPLLDKSNLKRLCFVSSEAGSINNSMRTDFYGYSMSKAALNMNVKILFNKLRPDGYTFRLYHPGWLRTYMSGVKATEGDLEADKAAVNAVAYFLRNRSFDAYNDKRCDEDRLVMRDWLGREMPW